MGGRKSVAARRPDQKEATMMDRQVVVKFRRIPTEWSSMQAPDEIEFMGNVLPVLAGEISMDAGELATLTLKITNFRIEYLEDEDVAG
jgi:hypothetical protein